MIPSTVNIKGVKYQVTSIAPKAFMNNKKLKKVVIPATIRSIEKQAFAGCKNLKKITVKTPYLTKKSVGAKAFKEIYTKAAIKVPKKQKKAYQSLFKAFLMLRHLTKASIILNITYFQEKRCDYGNLFKSGDNRISGKYKFRNICR